MLRHIMQGGSPMKHLAAAAIALGLSCPAAAETNPDAFDATAIDLPAYIECRAADIAAYQGFARHLAENEDAVEQALGLTEENSGNPMLKQYRLTKPITVFGRRADRIAFTASGVMALLAETDPHPIAKEIGVEPAFDRPGKYLGEKIVSEKEERIDTDTRFRSRIALNVSTVDSHPGRTLTGCTYSVEVE
jgi:hypothetical protein